VARTISDVIGRPIIYNDIDQTVWIDGAIVAGFVPAEYGVMLRWLTGSVMAGNSARPNDDIERVTGRPARRFEEFVRRNAAAWAQTLHELTLVSLTVVPRPSGSGRWPTVNRITRRSDVACR
jgi:hypothetical protein